MKFLHKDRILNARPAEVISCELPSRPRRSRRPISSGPRVHPPMRRAVFAYLGGSSRVVIGPATGAIYRFKAPGARLRIDPRDAAAMQKLAALARGE